MIVTVYLFQVVLTRCLLIKEPFKEKKKHTYCNVFLQWLCEIVRDNEMSKPLEINDVKWYYKDESYYNLSSRNK